MSAKTPPMTVRHEGQLTYLTFSRPDKRNAINDGTLDAMRDFFKAVPASTKVIVMSGEGGNFSAGLDLSEQVQREAHEVMHHSRGWHAVMDMMRFGGRPIVAALNGAVMGGGLEIAVNCHVRVAEPNVKFRLPEGQRGIFVGGGATVNVGKIIGPDRFTEMMLTGRTYSGAEGTDLGLAHYLVDEGKALEKATELALSICKNSSLVNYLIIQSAARIANMSSADGLYTESLAAALSQTGPDAEEGLRAFLEKRAPNFS